MLGKLLITAIVGGVVYFLWRKQQEQTTAPNRTGNHQQPRLADASPKPPIKLIFSSVLAIFILVTAAWMVYDWKDQRTLLEVKVITPNTSDIATYQVYKKDLQERGFTTRDGQLIRIANSERMEVRRLDAH
ncbi:hypothetical protein [Marinospirillum insulare]|uniref:Uncharacterized protein n=1 Tax=Marinospirillum insulare TaxID=217169 RepID=A0ABQ5ZUE9_9GAMM|nr:hypothetical protein [Marinospirillum insulare]GLR63801.1 hypothetical protein GCM10007878_12360 [Marinospirillum insulare]